MIAVLIPEPADIGGPKALIYELSIDQMQGSTVLATINLNQTLNLTDMRTFIFDSTVGLLKGYEYHMKARVHTYSTEYYN